VEGEGWGDGVAVLGQGCVVMECSLLCWVTDYLEMRGIGEVEFAI